MNQPSSGNRRVAYFGGSFDPPHLGHLAVARAARVGLGLDAVLFAPVGAQPLKPQGSTASFEERLEMTRLAIEGEAGMSLSLADAPTTTGGPNYTVETLGKLRAELPDGCRLYFLMGADSFFGLRRWHRAEEIPFAAPLIVASRPGQPLEGLRAALPEGLTMESCSEASETVRGVEVRCFEVVNAAGERAPFYLLPGLDVEISASAIRAQVRATGREEAGGQELLPEAVAAYVRARGLYR